MLEMKPVGEEVDPSLLPDELVWIEQRRIAIVRAVDSLPTKARQAIRLKYGLDGQERTLAEVSAIMRLSGERVRALCIRARRMLRHISHKNILKEYLNDY